MRLELLPPDDLTAFATAAIGRDAALADCERVIQEQATEIATQKRIITVLIDKIEWFGTSGKRPVTSR